MYNAISKALLYHCKDPKKPRVFLLGPTGTSAISIGGIIINSGPGDKPVTKLLSSNDRSLAV